MLNSILPSLPQNAAPSEKAALIAEMVLADLPDDVALAARRCVILHWFDQVIIAALAPKADQERAEFICRQLMTLPFIEPVPGGFAYHALTRQGMLNQYAIERVDLLITAAKLAIPAYAARTNNNQSIAEAFFCTIVAGEAETADKVLTDAYRTLSARGDWAAISYWFSLQDEAEALSFVKSLPRDFLQWMMRSIAHYFGKDWSTALVDLTHALELDPDNSIAFYNRGVTYAKQKNYDAALADYTRALELDPNDATAFYNRGNTYADLKNYAAALADYTRALELDPNLATAYSNRGVTYHEQKDYAAALADYTRALELDPNLAQAYSNRGATYAKQKNYDAALADYTRALELDPNYAKAFYNRGNTYADLKNYAAALADYTRTLELDPNDAEPVYNSACAYALQNNVEQACVWLRRAIQMSGECLEMARTDSDFDAIRNTQEFQALLREFESSHSP